VSGVVTDRERPLEPETPPAQLSRLLWQARESLEMWADTVEAKSRQPDDYTRGLVAEIDGYRALHGWSAGGYGGEWLCRCGDHFGPRDDDTPPVCALCRKAGRGVPSQDAVKSGVSGPGGNTDGRLERVPYEDRAPRRLGERGHCAEGDLHAPHRWLDYDRRPWICPGLEPGDLVGDEG